MTDPAGNMSEIVEAFDGVTTATTPEGSTRTSTEGIDARFGIEAPVMTDATLGPPSSLTWTLIGGRSVELTDTLDPLAPAFDADARPPRFGRPDGLMYGPERGKNTGLSRRTLVRQSRAC